MSDRIASVLVVGGGPAGLSAALWLGRHQLRTVVADRGTPRNRFVDAAFGYLGFDRASPDDILQAGRRDLQRYPTVTVEPIDVTSIHRNGDHFVSGLGDGQRLRTNAVILATGVVDEVPALPELDRHYGKAVFVCPICDGHELRGKRVVVLGAGGSAGAYAAEVLQWAGEVTVVPMGDERPGDRLPHGVTVAAACAEAIHGDGEFRGVRLVDGSVIESDAVFLRAEVHPRTEFAAHLGCALEPDGRITVDADSRTNVPRVYAAGDCTPGPQIVQVAAAEGTRAALACAQDIIDEHEETGDSPAQLPVT